MTQVLAEGFGFLEGPRWRDGRLWMSDIGRREVLTIDEAGRRTTVVAVPERPSGLGFLPDGTPLVVSMMDRKLYRIEDGELRLHADLSHLSRLMINDMLVDGLGRAYVGNAENNPFSPGREIEGETGQIILVEPDGAARVVATDLCFPNGMVVTPEGRLVVCESFNGRITSFAIEPDGGLSDRRLLMEVEGRPDGCCLDQEGGIWVGLGNAFKYIRILDGEIVTTVSTPDRRAIACQLGGADGRTLFCLTLGTDITGVDTELASRVETVRVESAAAGSP
jgi:sugar lactone lactonase YvrE